MARGTDRDGAGYELIADIAIGIVGALIGSWLLPQLGIHLGTGIVAAVICTKTDRCPAAFYLFSGSCPGGADGELGARYQGP